MNEYFEKRLNLLQKEIKNDFVNKRKFKTL